MPWTTNLEEEEIVDTPGNDGNTSMPEQVKRPNPWRKTMMMICYLHSIMSYGIIFWGASPHSINIFNIKKKNIKNDHKY